MMRDLLLGVGLFLLIALAFSPYTVEATEIFNPWNYTVALDDTYVNNRSEVLNGTLYLFGGSANTGVGRSRVFSNKIESDGTLNNWKIQSPMPRELIWHSSVLVNNLVYIIGGVEEQYPSINSTNAISVAGINEVGDIESWIDLPVEKFLPEKLGNGAVAKVGKYIYYLGGGKWTQSWPPIVSNKIYFTEIDSYDDIGVWKDTEVNLPTPLISHSVVVVNNRIYILGGSINSNFDSTYHVYVYEVDQNNGKLTRLQDEEDIPVSSRSAMAIRSGDYVILAGGVTDGHASDKVFYAPLNVGENIGQWKLSSHLLPQINCCTTISSWENFIYIMGGHNAIGPYYSTVIYTQIGTFSTPTPTSVPESTPTPTPTIAPTPTAIPTPTPTIRPPVVIIPGIGASWNYEGIVHGKTDIADTDWKISSYIKIYDGLIKSFEEAGYELGHDLFVYAYDWRRNVPETALRVNQFINTSVQKGDYTDSRVNIIGHSMGGLVAAKYLQDFGTGDVNKVVTLGTPYAGAVKAYKMWEGADFSDFKGHESLLIRSLLGIHGIDKMSVVDSLRQYSPSIQGLLPTFDYLLDNRGTIPVSTLIWRNNLSGAGWNNVSQFLSPVAGTDFKTTRKLLIKKADTVDRFYGRWVDGEPVGDLTTNDGDGTVLLSSSKPNAMGSLVTFAGTDHSGLVETTSSQSKILEMFGSSTLGYSIEQPKYDNALIVTVGSPGTFKVVTPNGQIITPVDGLVVINNPANGVYKAEVTSTGAGKYTVYVGRIKGNSMVWNDYPGDFSTSGQIQTKTFSVDMSKKDLGGKPLYKAWSEFEYLKKIIGNCKLAKSRKSALMAYVNFLQALVERSEKASGRDAYKLIMGTFIPSLDKFYRDSDLLVDKPNRKIKDEINSSMERVMFNMRSDYYERF